MLLSCSKQDKAPHEISIGVWGNWTAAELRNPADYKGRMILAPLYYRYLFDTNPEFSIIDHFDQRGDSLNFSIQEGIKWENGDSVTLNDVLQFIHDKIAISFTYQKVDSNSATIVLNGELQLSWYFHTPFILNQNKGGNGLYRVDVLNNKSLKLLLNDTAKVAYPHEIAVSFLGEKPDIKKLSALKFDMILQLPITYYQDLMNFPGYQISKKNRENLTALFFNADKLDNCDYYRRIIEQQIDRKVITDAIMWNYAVPVGAPDAESGSKKRGEIIFPERGKQKVVRVLLNNNPIRVKVLQEISSEIPPSYFTIDPDIVDWQEFKGRLRSNEFEVAFLEWTFDTFLDIFELWAGNSDFSASSLTRIKNDEVKKYLSTYRDNWDRETKDKYFTLLNEKIHEIFPVVFLYRQNFLYLSRDKTVIDVAADNWFKNILKWQLEAENE